MVQVVIPTERREFVKKFFDQVTKQFEKAKIDLWIFSDWIRYQGLIEGAKDTVAQDPEGWRDGYTVIDEALETRDMLMDDSSDFIIDEIDDALRIGKELDPDFDRNFAGDH